MVPRRAPDRLLGDEVEPHLLERGLLLLAARELGQLADQRGHLGELRDDVGEELLAVLGRHRRRREASTSMFVRRLVSGVRSSCDASWTSWRWRCAASSSDASIALKVVASRLSSSVPGHLDPLREVAGRADVLGRRRSGRRTGLSAARATRKPGDRRDADPADRDERSARAGSWRARGRPRRAEAAIWTA